MNYLKTFVKILTHLSVIAMVAGMAMMSLYVTSSKPTLIIPAIGLLVFEFHTARSKGASSLHFSAAVAAFFILFYLSLFGATCPAKEKFLSFALLTSAVWMIGRFGFFLGRLASKKRQLKNAGKDTRGAATPTDATETPSPDPS